MIYIVFPVCFLLSIFFFNDTATTEIYTLSLHDALPIYARLDPHGVGRLEQLRPDAERPLASERLLQPGTHGRAHRDEGPAADRKSTRLNSSHGYISYAVFCLKKKKE